MVLFCILRIGCNVLIGNDFLDDPTQVAMWGLSWRTLSVGLQLQSMSNPSEKYESQLGLLFPIYGKTCSKPPISITDHKLRRPFNAVIIAGHPTKMRGVLS